MQYGKPGGTAGGLVAGNAVLAYTGFKTWILAELGVALLVLGLVLVRVSKMRRRRE